MVSVCAPFEIVSNPFCWKTRLAWMKVRIRDEDHFFTHRLQFSSPITKIGVTMALGGFRPRFQFSFFSNAMMTNTFSAKWENWQIFTFEHAENGFMLKLLLDMRKNFNK